MNEILVSYLIHGFYLCVDLPTGRDRRLRFYLLEKIQ